MAAITFPKYEQYKDSGVEWLGEIPEHWQVKPGLACIKESKTKNIGLKEETVLSLSYGKIIIKPKEKLTGLVPESFETYQIIEPGDVIIRTTDLQNDKTSLRTGIARNKGIITSAYLNLRPLQGINAGFIHYLLHGYDLMKVFYGMGSGLRQNLDYKDFKRLPLLIPTDSEAARIATFLDQKTAEIDAAIAKKQSLIRLLNEQKAILINRAVTRGLNPDVKMKDSGVAWIGEIPEHWEIKRAKYLFKIIDERSDTGQEELLSVSHMTGVTPRSEKSNIYMFMAEDYTGSKICREGDLVFNIMWAWMGALGVSDRVGIVSPSYGVYRQITPGTFNSWFLEQLLRSVEYVAEYNRRSTGLHSSRLRLYPDMFFDMEMGMPSRKEQDEIESTVQQQSRDIDAVMVAAQKEISTLQELKQTLITHATTGKIKV